MKNFRDRKEGQAPSTPENVIYGRHPVVEAINAGQRLEKVYLLQGTQGELEKELRILCRDKDIPLVMVPREKLSKLGKGLDYQNHQGVVAVLPLIEYQLLQDILPTILENKEEQALFMILDGVTDVRNFGAIARSAEAAGVHAIIISQKQAAPVNGEAMKASSGAINNIPICREKSLTKAIELLMENNIQIVAADVEGFSSLPDVDFNQPTAVIMGAEGEGINRAYLRKSSKRFQIPMKGKTASYNVSVAAGIILYESLRQRQIKLSTPQ